MSLTHRDRNHAIVWKALANRCGGYTHEGTIYKGKKLGVAYRDKVVKHHYAFLRGLHVAAYDLHSVGNGVPDWQVFVSWFAIFFEVKSEREVKAMLDDGAGDRDEGGHFKTGNRFGHMNKKLNDREYYYHQLEETERTFAFHHPGIVAIVATEEQVYDWLSLCADFVEYIEHRAEGSQAMLELFFRNAVPHATNLFDVEKARVQ